MILYARVAFMSTVQLGGEMILRYGHVQRIYTTIKVVC